MKNLVVKRQKVNVYNEDYFTKEKYYCCYNADNDRYYTIDDKENNVVAVNVATNKRYTNQMVFFAIEEAKAVGIEYCSVTQEFFVASDCGIVSCVTHMENDKIKYEDIAEFPNGLQCIKLSPDHEMVVLVTKDDIVITLTSNFEILNEVSLRSEEFGKKQFITVGWGKKETQFHGSEGKAAAKAKTTVSGRTETDDGVARVSWKGNGSFFAVSYIDQQFNARRFKVFNREGVLQYTSELVDCLEETLSWKPSSNLIASTRKLPNKHTVALFEKNGLLHREFTLPFEKKNVKIIDLIWSRDSDILAVWYKDVKSSTMTIQLWSENNYHWYLKQTITYPKNVPIHYVTWGCDADKDLMILSSKSSTIYTFNWAVAHSNGKSNSDKAVVGVIDANKVLVTCFKDSIVPPPMASRTLEFKEPVNAIAFAPHCDGNDERNTNDFMVVLSNNKIIHCHLELDGHEQCKAYNVDFQLKEANNYSFHLIQHMLWYSKHLLLCTISLGQKSSLCELHLIDIPNLDVILIDAKIVQEMPGQIDELVSSPTKSLVYAVCEGKLYAYSSRDGLRRCELRLCPEPSYKPMLKVELVKFQEEEVFIALARKNVLYVDGEQVANNVTSFFSHSNFLLFTTSQHALVCIPYKDGLQLLRNGGLNVPGWENEAGEVRRNEDVLVRRVERGSLLVTAEPQGARVILQMPRGNLECIEPRALVILAVCAHLRASDYLRAFEVMRRQRLDLNLIHDYQPDKFVEDAQLFVQQLMDKPSWISLFLTELRDEDVTRTMYAGGCKFFDEREDGCCKGKVKRICELIRKKMENYGDKFVQPILVSLVRGSDTQSGLESALLKIKSLRGENEALAEDALRFVLYMVDVNALYDVALGMYDFELVLFVAQKSLKDPKEYLAELRDLKALDENAMRFQINRRLKRYDAALEDLARIPERADECLEFVEAHGLYAKALKLFAPKTDTGKRVARGYAKFLEGKGKHREAGIMYVRGASYQEALKAFKLAGCWKDAIFAALQLGLSDRQMMELYEELVAQLIENKKFDEAATILSKYLNRLEDAVATLCQGRHWHQAWFDAYFMKRTDLIETHVKPGIQSHAEFLLSQLCDRRKEFNKHASRLAVIRAEGPKRYQQQFAGEDETIAGHEVSDLVSETSVAASTTISRASSSRSGRSYRSSKNRRKHERKLQSIKEGSVYEDLALIRALHGIVSQAYATKNEIKAIAEMLLYINCDQLAEELYEAMNEFLDDIRKNKSEIWPTSIDNKGPVSDESNNSSNNSSNTNSPSHTNAPLNLIEPHLLMPPEEKLCDWKLDMFSISH